MTADEVVDAHIFLVSDTSSSLATNASKILEVERNDAVCRKLIWVRNLENIESSFTEFVERTFLAHPWENAIASDQAPLDQNTHVISDVLVSQGLTVQAAEIWIKAAIEITNDPAKLVEELVDALEASS